MKGIVFVVLLVIFCCFNLFGQKAQTGFTDDEYKFISEIWSGSKDSLLVIKNNTIPANLSEEEGNRGIHLDGRESISYLKEQIADLSDEIIKDFNLKNDKAYQLQRKFTFAGKYELMSENDVSKIFYEAEGDLDSGWENFKNKYPNSFGYIQFSRIGFNKDRNQALIYSTSSGGSFSAEGSYIFYVKEKEKWVRKKEVILWNA